MTLRILLLIIVACFARFGVKAQTSSVKIIDFSVMPLYHTDTIAQSDTVFLSVMFKTKNAVQASKAKVLFGTANDASDVKLIQAMYSNSGNTVSLSCEGISEPVNNYATNATIALTRQQYNAFTNATLFVEDVNGQTTQHLYFQKH